MKVSQNIYGGMIKTNIIYVNLSISHVHIQYVSFLISNNCGLITLFIFLGDLTSIQITNIKQTMIAITFIIVIIYVCGYPDTQRS